MAKLNIPEGLQGEYTTVVRKVNSDFSETGYIYPTNLISPGKVPTSEGGAEILYEFHRTDLTFLTILDEYLLTHKPEEIENPERFYSGLQKALTNAELGGEETEVMEAVE